MYTGAQYEPLYIEVRAHRVLILVLPPRNPSRRPINQSGEHPDL
jgi:hypothetical protein